MSKYNMRQILMVEYMYDRGTWNRQYHILKWLYDNKDTCTIDDGNLLYVYKQVGDPERIDPDFHDTLDDLMTHDLIEQDEPPMDCFYNITDKGIYYIDNVLGVK